MLRVLTFIFLASMAFAQVSFPADNLRKTLKVSAADNEFAYNRGTVKLELLAGLVYKLEYRGPIADYASAGQVLAAGLGQPGIAQGFASYMDKNAAQVRSQGKVQLQVSDGFEFLLELSDQLAFTLAPQEVADFGQDRNILGKQGVMIREFSDFQCPYCIKLHKEVFPAIKQRFLDSGQARFSYRHLPLFEIHPQSLPAALASECAASQGKFWDFHDSVFTKGFDYTSRAKEAKMDIPRFQTCMSNAQSLDIVYSDFNLARKLGLNGTPSVFVGPFKLPNPYDIATYERYLKMAAAHP